MMVLTGIKPLFINAGLRHTPTVPCLDAYGEVAGDPRNGDALPSAARLFAQGERIGTFLSARSDLLVLGECVPGGTTTALCLLRALGYEASVSSSFANNPVSIKEEVCRQALERAKAGGSSRPARPCPFPWRSHDAGGCRDREDLYRHPRPCRGHPDAGGQCAHQSAGPAAAAWS